jgi:hypothetical protein
MLALDYAICEAYPVLEPDDVRAALAWTQAALRNDLVLDVSQG